MTTEQSAGAASYTSVHWREIDWPPGSPPTIFFHPGKKIGLPRHLQTRGLLQPADTMHIRRYSPKSRKQGAASDES